MIGSITEVQQQLAELAQRRQQAAAQNVAAPATPAAVPLAATAVGSGPVAPALKSATADAAKRRKGKDRGRHEDDGERERVGRDLRDDPLTPAHEAAQASEHPRKSYADRGAELGPGQGTMPGHPEPESFDRSYLEAGHAAESPQAEPARTNPMLLMQHRVLPEQPRAAAIPPAVIEHFTMGSPSDR